MGRRTVRREVLALKGAEQRKRSDRLVAEEPLEIRVGGESFAVTMRTPGSDFELAQGLLHSEGIIAARDDVSSIRYCAGTDEDGQQTYNVLDVELAGLAKPMLDVVRRNTVMSSSCGLCGKASMDSVRTMASYDLHDDHTTVDAAVLSALPDRLRDDQKVFASTGGLHGAGLYDDEGNTIVVREDIGRHNAVDKVLGWCLENGRVPASGTILLVSGRASFELVQKAVMAGIPILAAVSAPSSLAADLADESGLTLVGFLRGESMNIYTHPERVTG